ncbi:hypothetical protein B0H21DRAFT_807959 [Amylocystis lapponica]|nr:hypothetical protein B0H21DRAFT_807959 [Amylocystis lapponica]
MSSREPMWYCHEASPSSVTIVQVPDPHCASCNGTFVEKMENPADDPREFQHAPNGFEEDELPPDMDGFLAGLRTLLRNGPASAGSGAASRPTSPRFPGTPNVSDRSNGGTFTIRVQRSGSPGNGTRTVIMGNSSRQSSTDGIPLFSEFVSGGGANARAQDQGGITGPLMAQYLLAMLGSRPGHGDPLHDMLGGAFGGPGGAENGRWGDYVFNQEALDQIITQMMENSNASAPVAATEEIVNKLPREVLEEGCPMLEESCAVCKDQFKLETDDPDEQVVVTLPCKHPFHEPCILPWLKSSGTCPVCRYQLVPQPEHHAPGPGPPRGSGSGPSNRTGSPPTRFSDTNSSQGGGSLFGQLFGFGGANEPGGSTQRSNTRSANAGRRSRESDRDNIPGGWDEQLD